MLLENNLKLLSKVFHLHWKDICANQVKLIFKKLFINIKIELSLKK